ncbi:hypothetical protein [Pseudomonas sp. LB3P38]|uniref:hypothetical protein n=1 Tax=Pseudomonas lyxosi TaxID=3398358 RepID=UPI0039F11A4F
MSISDSAQSTTMAGKIDLAFGVNGVATIDVPGATGSIAVGVINGPGDKLYVCGTAQIHGTSKFFITALNSTGNVISEFGDNGYVIGEFGEAKEESHATELLLSGNKLLLVGASYIGADPYPALAQIDLLGNFDTTFGENGQGKIVIHLPGPPGTSSDQGYSDTFKPDSTSSDGTQIGSVTALGAGKILLSHYFFRPGAPSYGVILRTLANGSLDTDFVGVGYLAVIAPGYKNAQTQIQSVTVDSEGRYVACGSLYDLGSSPVKTFFARYSSEGEPDSTFGPQGFRIGGNPDGLSGGARAEVLIPLESGSILSLGGSVHDPYVGQLMKLKENGEPDPDFNRGEPHNTQLAESSTLWKTLTRQADGKLVVAGAIDQQKNSFVFDIVVARFDKTGKLDPHFNDGPGWARTRLSSKTDGAYAIALQPDKIVIAGLSQSKGIVVRYHA